MKIRIGTRGSELAMWQARFVAGLLGSHRTEIIVIKTQGDAIQNVSFDKMEGKGFFTREIEQALLDKKIDLAVHSLKDLPTENPPGLVIAAVPERGDPADTLLVSSEAWDGEKSLCIKPSAVVGTSSMRRMASFDRLPTAILAMLLFVAGATLSVAGYSAGRANSLRRWRMTALTLILAAVMVVITDFDRPLSGSVQTDQQGYVDLANEMEESLAAP